jgi:DNA-binding LytR/AlgR family response regulator
MPEMSDDTHAQIRQTPPRIREPQSPAVHEAPIAARIWDAMWQRWWVGMIVVGLVPGFILAILGPFGSFAAPFWMRLAYWVPTMVAGGVIGAGISIWMDNSQLFERRPILLVAVFSTVMTAVMTFVAWGVGALVFGPEHVAFGWLFVFYVWIVTMIITGITTVMRAHRIAVAAAPVATNTPATAPSLSARLPEKLKGGAILALEGEDHYVRIHTDKGSDLVLIRLGDAVSEMGSTPGARTHRSWWVARQAVKSVRRDNGRTSLVLTTGAEVPVSRGYASELREAGWFANG